jgi:hypothetical protein
VGGQPHPQQAGPKIPSSLNVHEKVAITILCGIWSKLLNPASAKLPKVEASAMEKGGNICCPTFFYSRKFHKIVNHLIFEQEQKNI